MGRRGSPDIVLLNSHPRHVDAQLAKAHTIKKRLAHGYKGSSIEG
jgi:acyl dehydratase